MYEEVSLEKRIGNMVRMRKVMDTSGAEATKP